MHGNLYGTTLAAIAAVRDAGKVCILDLDVQGAESVKRASLGAKFLFVAPPSMDELERRLRGRGTETEEKVRPVALGRGAAGATHCCTPFQIRVRLVNAQREMSKRDEPGFVDVVIVNDDLDAAYAQLTGACNAAQMQWAGRLRARVAHLLSRLPFHTAPPPAFINAHVAPLA